MSKEKKKQVTFITVLSLAFLIIMIVLGKIGANRYMKKNAENTEIQKRPVTVRLMKNYSERITLKSGHTAEVDNVLFMTIEAGDEGKLAKPSETPVRPGYEFTGWSEDREGTVAFDFSCARAKSTVAFATWKRSETASAAEEYFEPDNVGPIVLCGSSSIENWKSSERDMRPITTVNTGVGGTTVDQWRDHMFKERVVPYSPRAIVMYLGINNVINSGDSGKETGEKLAELFDYMHEALPELYIYYIPLNTVPGYMNKKDEIDEANAIVREYAASHTDFIQLIEAGDLLMKESGKPNAAYFLTDGLHMSLSGYAIWGQAVRSAVIAKEGEIYK